MASLELLHQSATNPSGEALLENLRYTAICQELLKQRAAALGTSITYDGGDPEMSWLRAEQQNLNLKIADYSGKLVVATALSETNALYEINDAAAWWRPNQRNICLKPVSQARGRFAVHAVREPIFRLELVKRLLSPERHYEVCPINPETMLPQVSLQVLD